MTTWHIKVRVIRVFRVPDCDTRITRNNFGFCKLLPEIPEQNSGFGYFGFGFGYSGFGFRVTGFLPSPNMFSTNLGTKLWLRLFIRCSFRSRWRPSTSLILLPTRYNSENFVICNAVKIWLGTDTALYLSFHAGFYLLHILSLLFWGTHGLCISRSIELVVPTFVFCVY
jgi:hypothetical protein